LREPSDPKTVETLTKQAEALIDKLGPEYYKLMDWSKSIGNPVKPKNLCPYFQSLTRDAPSKAFRGRASAMLGSQVAQQGRGAKDCQQYRQAAGALAELATQVILTG
jgi:hypothetical protein